MRVLLAGEIGAGSLATSLSRGLTEGVETTMVDPSGVSGLVDRHGLAARVRRKVAIGASDRRLIEAVRDHEPDALLIVKGRGISAEAIEHVRRLGVTVAVYYPDNPWWVGGDTPGALDRLQAADLAIVWSDRLAERLQPRDGAVAVVPFGYDERWYAGGDPDAPRSGVAFLGTWSRRRQRFLEALVGLPLVVRGTGWPTGLPFAVGPPVYEADGGDLLRGCAIGVNLLHPQCAGAHNMRTREIAASGAFQITEPGLDGTPFRDGAGCAWFRSPDGLRAAVDRWLSDREGAVEQARLAASMVAGDTYVARGRQLAALLEAARP